MDWERAILYERINTRVDLMLEAGLLEEAKALYPYKELTALRTVGYQELFDYFDEKISLEEASELIKRNSRRYAKRQMTWNRKVEGMRTFAPRDFEGIISFLEEEKGIRGIGY